MFFFYFTKNIFHKTYLQLFRLFIYVYIYIYIYIYIINKKYKNTKKKYKKRQNKKYSYIIYTKDDKNTNIIHWFEIPPYEQSSCSGEFHCFRILRREEEKLTRRAHQVLKSCFCNRFPFCLNTYFEVNRKLIIFL